MTTKYYLDWTDVNKVDMKNFRCCKADCKMKCNGQYMVKKISINKGSDWNKKIHSINHLDYTYSANI